MTGAGSYWDPITLTRDTEFVEPDSEDFYYTDKIGAEAVKQIEKFAELGMKHIVMCNMTFFFDLSKLGSSFNCMKKVLSYFKD